MTQERNRVLSSVARTLTTEAAKRDDTSLKELADEMRAGKRPTNDSQKSSLSFASSKNSSTKSQDDESSALSSIQDSPDSAISSIDTAVALSLCGVQLDDDEEDENEAPHKSESPASIMSSIDTAEAISLCGGMQATSSDQVIDKEKEEDTTNVAWFNKYISTRPPDANDSNSDPGSESVNEVVDEIIPTKQDKVNPMRASLVKDNPEPYESYDVLLQELRASGRILHDNSIASYGSTNSEEK